MFSEQAILDFFVKYAYQPWVIYTAIITLMTLSSFGLPVPEEITLVTSGFICYIGKNPHLYPPPYPGAEAVNPITTAIVAFHAVFLSDVLVFFMGKILGKKILRFRLFNKYESHLDKISTWTKKYGAFAAGIFRFTPALRFPGHFSCGMMGLSTFRFFLVDGTVALLSVPTQVLFVAYYGKEIMQKLNQFRNFVIIAVIIAVIAFIIYKVHKHLVNKKQAKLQTRNQDTAALPGTDKPAK